MGLELKDMGAPGKDPAEVVPATECPWKIAIQMDWDNAIELTGSQGRLEKVKGVMFMP